MNLLLTQKYQMQQNKANGKLRLFRKVKVNLNFEDYLSRAFQLI